MFNSCKVSDLIKKSKLTPSHDYGFYIDTYRGRVDCVLQLVNNRVYFFAKVVGHELPCQSYRIPRTTTLSELVKNVSNVIY